MRELYRFPNKLLPGSTSLCEFAAHSRFHDHLVRGGVNKEEHVQITGILINLSENLKDISALRKVLSENPQALGLSIEDTSKLLTLFIDVRAGVEYRRKGCQRI